MTPENIVSIPCKSVRFVKELYPRIKPIDEVVERYRDALDSLPPITIARDGILVDGYHRWQAHVREGRENVSANDLGNLSDAEIIRESIVRNASHGQQLSRVDKQRLAGFLWQSLGHLQNGERLKDIANILMVGERSVDRWTKESRKAEKEEKQSRALDMWLDCATQESIAEAVAVPQQTLSGWITDFRQMADFGKAPESRQHFDIWQFQSSDKDSGQQSYFGAMPPQVVENLLWFFTEPGDVVVDLFAGSGTTVDVAKRMGRRVWASDIRGNHYCPHLPVHKHDATDGWPADAPSKADLVFLDPPYWKQAAGRYSSDLGELAEMGLDRFMDAWGEIVSCLSGRSSKAAFIISPTQNDDGSVVDHATEMLAAFNSDEWFIERRIIVPYSTQQATGQQVTWARENKRMLKLYRDLVVLSK